MKNKFTDSFTIPNNAPERFRGRTMTIHMNEKKKELEFIFPNVEGELTDQELGYIKWISSEVADQSGLKIENRRVYKLDDSDNEIPIE